MKDDKNYRLAKPVVRYETLDRIRKGLLTGRRQIGESRPLIQYIQHISSQGVSGLPHIMQLEPHSSTFSQNLINKYLIEVMSSSIFPEFL